MYNDSKIFLCCYFGGGGGGDGEDGEDGDGCCCLTGFLTWTLDLSGFIPKT